MVVTVGPTSSLDCAEGLDFIPRALRRCFTGRKRVAIGDMKALNKRETKPLKPSD